MFGVPSPRTCVYAAVLGMLVYFLKQYMRGATYSGTERMDGKVVVITGANSGIGKETAKELTSRGARVIMACRDLARCGLAQYEIIAATGKSPQCMELDLSSFASIRAFAAEFNSKYDRLDVLINNAGVMMTPKLLTSDGLELQSGVNHFGHFLLTKLLLDKVKAAAPSRVIVVSSMAHMPGEIDLKTIAAGSANYSPRAAYSQSKLANILFANELARRLAGSGVTVNSLHPGVIDSELWRHVPFINTRIGSLLFEPVKNVMFKTPVEGAQTTLRLALDPDLHDVTGKYFSDCTPITPGPQAQDEAMAGKLWELSETVTGTVTVETDTATS